MRKLERLLNLVAALLDTPRPLTLDEVATRVEGYPDKTDAMRRAFERDKDDLRSMGIPIRVDDVPATDPPVVGYRILKSEYAGVDPDLEPDELAALHVAASMVRLDGVDGSEAVMRLGGAEGAANGGVDGAQAKPLAALPTDPNLAPLFTAAAERRTVTLTYGDQVRELDPWRISFVRGRWYVKGFDHLRQAERMYRVERIDGTVTVGSTSKLERPAETAPTRLAGWEIGDEEPVSAQVKIDAAQSSWARHYVGRDAVVDEDDDGNIVLELTVRNREAFRSFVLTFLDGAEVLSPPSLRDDVVDWLQKVVAANAGAGSL